MSAAGNCPGIECWQALLGDTIGAVERDCYEQHLESCSACQERLHQIEADEDNFRTLGRRVGDPTIAPRDATLVRVLERLHEAKTPLGIAPPEPAELYFLHPSEQPGVLGLLGTYEVREVIGQGGMGVVLKAFEPALNRLVAIKVLAAAVAGSATARRRFTREAQAAAAVCHDHVIAVHGVDTIDGLPYLVMQYVAGESLQERLDRTGPLEVVETVRIGLQTALGLAAAHAQGLIHRDIKPANLLLENGLARVKITDFGLARMADDVGLTQNGVVAGTPEYMAPEQARGEVVDHRADLFSLGSVLYACCTGVPPFRGSTALAVLSQVSEKDPPPIRSLNADVPEWLEAFIARLLAKDPAQRFQSAAEVAAMLESYLVHLNQPAKAPAPELPAPIADAVPWPMPQGVVKRFLQYYSLPALVLFALLGLGVSFCFQPGTQPLNPAGVDQEKPRATEGGNEQRKQDRLVVGLPAGIDKLPPSLLLFGPDVESVIKVDSQGWRITLPAGRDSSDFIGLQLLPRLCGDFVITLGYELLSVGEPLPQHGAGMQIRVWFDEPSSPSAILYRGKKPFGQVFATHRTLKGADGQEQWLDNLDAKATQSKGRLRLARTGSRLQYLVAEEGKNFRMIKSVEIGTADVREAQVFCTTMYQPIALDVRWTELEIRADKIGNQN